MYSELTLQIAPFGLKIGVQLAEVQLNKRSARGNDDIQEFSIFGGDVTPIPPILDSNSITISTRFRSSTKLFWKLRFRVVWVANSRLSAFQRTKNYQKPFTELGDRVHQRCRSGSATEHARLHAYQHVR